jgi:hypothetical protein
VGLIQARIVPAQPAFRVDETGEHVPIGQLGGANRSTADPAVDPERAADPGLIRLNPPAVPKHLGSQRRVLADAGVE